MDIKQRLGVSSCFKCGQLTHALKKALHYLSKLKSEIIDNAMTIKLDKLFLKSFKVLEGLHID